jgi:N-acetylmuramoyl-L-alanine amidase
MAELLKYQLSHTADEFRMTRGNVTLRVVPGAAVAWADYNIVSLLTAPILRNGVCWMDVQSSLLLFDTKNESLQFAGDYKPPGADGRSGPSGRRSEPIYVDGLFENSENRARMTEVMTERPTAPTAERRVNRPAGSVSPTPARQPRDSAGSSLKQIRWQEGAGRIRMVVECGSDTEPQVQTLEGQLIFTFDRADPLGSDTLSYRNVEAALQVRGAQTILTVRAPWTRLGKQVLENPKRLVYDFYMSAQAQAAQTPAVQAPIPIPLPVGTWPTQAPTNLPPRSGGRRVVIDPGHGGKDPGTSGNGIIEKDVVLILGRKIVEGLKTKGVDARLTRDTDIYLTLQERTEIANEANADLFVSVHINALPEGKNVAGFEIYLMAPPSDKDALDLAVRENRELVDGKTDAEAADRKTRLLLNILGDMQQNNKITQSTGLAEVLFNAGQTGGLPMRRVAQAPFFVLRGAAMPAVLLEVGFVTNVREAKLLAHPGYQQRLADSIVQGIMNYEQNGEGT